MNTINMKRIITATVSTVSIIGLLGACSLDKLVDVDKPQVGTEVDHDYLDTRAGSLALLHTAIGSLQKGLSSAALDVGLITDELTSRPPRTLEYQYGSAISSDTRFEPVDYRGVKGIQFNAYSVLQRARIHANEARYFLRRRSDSTLAYAISAAYAVEGYAITMLAENLCSGVPLSESPYGQTTVYGSALSTDSLLKIAVTKFDSALAIQHDSARFKTLATVGKSRALLSLGRYADASQAVAGVEQGDVYNVYYTEQPTPKSTGGSPTFESAFWAMTPINSQYGPYLGHEILNNEGNNGLIWFVNPEAIDPRVPVTVEDMGVKIFPLIVRQKKFVDGNAVLPLASWIDAKMVEAEHLLSINDPAWINAINAARHTIGLADTAAPTSSAQQVNLLFRERAFWFYGQATRLADMRRLVRQYGRAINTVFPIGPYTRSDRVYTYGDATTFIPSAVEYQQNYKYSGCINRNP